MLELLTPRLARSRRRRPGLAADRRGIVALVTAILIVPLILAVGAAIYFAQLMSAHTALQDAVDDAAVAGAIVFSQASDASNANAVATNFINHIPLPNTIAFGSAHVSTAAGAAYLGGTANNVTVSATATVATPFLSNMLGNVTITATSTASNPVFTLLLSAGHFGSSAFDWDSVYLYAVPMSGGNPLYGTIPDPSTFYEIGSNCNSVDTSYSSSSACNGQPGATVPTGQVLPTLTANQPIAFALKNVTGDVSPYSPNQYGSVQGNVNWFYSALEMIGEPPSQITDTSQSSTTTTSYQYVCGYFLLIIPEYCTGYNTTTTTTSTNYPTTANSSTPNCSLQVEIVNPSNLPTTPPSGGSCFATNNTASGYEYGALSCSQMNGKTYMFWWNDMGGGTDDKDYNDAYYTVTCLSSGSSGNTQVVLTK